ncbi:MAG: DEAD/DEAH box helicase [Hyphomicrobium sp.]|nr:MAG: DEAD/DEAH box helicase [Hyphomicrobium sp.]PPD01729.1 MAG: DEAD/DEAH box helicase [Hyphomicrobium sp.]
MEPTTFADLGLSPKVQTAITAAGYTTPTPIQTAAIPVAVAGRDVLGIAQTGTGKTASFVLPMITRLETGRARARMPRSLILAPTRELAAQVEQSFDKYGINHKLTVALLIGGVSMDDQVKKLDRGVDVLIATPGRLLDHFGRGRVMLMGVEILVIDEADRMLDMGFIPDIEKICKLLPPRRQTLFFSATMPPEITRLVNQFLTDPVRVEVAKPATTAKTITQLFQYCPNGEDWAKREMLRDMIKTGNVKNAIIFCNRKRDVAILHKSLSKHGFNAGALHGDMDQKSRMETLDKFRSGEIMLLAASDVAARGLDIPDVSHVFNFDLPWAADDYVHRIGRTGRAGKEGISASLVSPDDLKFVKDIEKITGETAVWMGDAPSEDDVSNAGKRRRGGRGGKGTADRGSAPSHMSARPAKHHPDRAKTEPRSPQNANRQRSAPIDRPVQRQHGEQPQHAAPNVKAASDKSHISAPAIADRPTRQPEQRRPSPVAQQNSQQRQRTDREPRHDAWTDQPRSDRPTQQPRPDQQRRHEPKKPVHNPASDRTGFAENIPAFMRKSSRPTKAPGRG